MASNIKSDYGKKSERMEQLDAQNAHKIFAEQIKCMRVTPSIVTKVGIPTPSSKEIRKNEGHIVLKNLNQPMSIKEFKLLVEGDQRIYLKRLFNRFPGLSINSLVKMFGCSRNEVKTIVKDLVPDHKFKAAGNNKNNQINNDRFLTDFLGLDKNGKVKTEYVTVTEAQKLLGLNNSNAIYAAIKDKQLIAIKKDGRWRIEKESLTNFHAQKIEEAAPAKVAPRTDTTTTLEFSDLMETSEVAEYLSCTVKNISNLINRGYLTIVCKKGRLNLFSRKEVEALAEARKNDNYVQRFKNRKPKEASAVSEFMTEEPIKDAPKYEPVTLITEATKPIEVPTPIPEPVVEAPEPIANATKPLVPTFIPATKAPKYQIQNLVLTCNAEDLPDILARMSITGKISVVINSVD